MKDTVTVYWTSPTYVLEGVETPLLYKDPESLFLAVRKQRSPQLTAPRMFACPASNDLMNKVYVVSSPIDDYLDIPEGILPILCNVDGNDGAVIPAGGKLSLKHARQTSIEGYSNVVYGMAWCFFADEPLMAKFTAPYYPAVVPCDKALLSMGEFDIGLWYRPYNLDYHIPVTTTHMAFKKNDPLFFVEFDTDKEIVFKQFVETSELRAISDQLTNSPYTSGAFKPLKKRYEDAKRALVPQHVLAEIKRNVVD